MKYTEEIKESAVEAAKILVKHHIAYGRHYFYPMNEIAKKLLHFANTTGIRKAFTPNQIKAAKELGMLIEIQPMSIQ